MAWMLILVIVPGILINRWLTAKENKRKQRGFEVKLNTGDEPVTEKKENDHG